MKKNRVTLTLGGINKEGGFFKLGDYIHQLQNLSGALKQIDRALNKEETTYYRVVGLQLSSPSKITVEAIPKNKDRDYSGVICDGLLKEFDAIKEKKKTEETVDYEVLTAIKRLIEPINEKFSVVTIENNGNTAELSRQMQAEIDVLTVKETRSYGTIKGQLEQINLHNQANKFFIYPIVGPDSVLCHFSDEEVKEKAKKALEYNVSVIGLMVYKINSNFPYKIEVDDVEIFSQNSELPTMLDLVGKLPNITGGLSSEEYVKQIRDDWEAVDG